MSIYQNNYALSSAAPPFYGPSPVKMETSIEVCLLPVSELAPFFLVTEVTKSQGIHFTRQNVHTGLGKS